MRTSSPTNEQTSSSPNDEKIDEYFQTIVHYLQKLNTAVFNLQKSQKDTSIDVSVLLKQYSKANEYSTLLKSKLAELTILLQEEWRRMPETETRKDSIRKMNLEKLNSDHDKLRNELEKSNKIIKQKEKEQTRKRVLNDDVTEEPTIEQPVQKQNLTKEMSLQLLLEEEGIKFDKILEYEEEDELKHIEQGVEELREMFTTTHDAALEQEEQLKMALGNVENAAVDTEIGTKDLQTAMKWKTSGTLIAVTALGGVVGCAIGGPIGAVVAAKTAFGLATTIGVGTVAGFGIGAVSGFSMKQISDKVSGANLKFWKKKTEETSAVDAEEGTDERLLKEN
jgi:t-SNARE complex subunit (syntaxin)